MGSGKGERPRSPRSAQWAVLTVEKFISYVTDIKIGDERASFDAVAPK